MEVVLVEAPPDPQAAHDSPPSIAAAAVAMDGGAAAVATDGGAAAAAVTAAEAFAAKAAHAEATAERLFAELSDRLRPGMKEEVQKETAALIALISDLAYEEFTEFFPLARVAVAAPLPPRRRTSRWRAASGETSATARTSSCARCSSCAPATRRCR